MLEFSECKQKWIWNMIFIRIPKNASTSIYSHLGDFNLVKKYEKHFNDCFFNEKLYKKWFSPTHAKPDEIYRIFGGMVKNYMSFAIVRNPFDRAVSMFQFAKENNLGDLYNQNNDFSFSQFCEIMNENHLNNEKNFIAIHQQTEWLQGMFEPDFILQFENLKKDFEEMLQICRIKHVNSNIPHQNSSNRSSYQNYYNGKTQKIIAKIFEKDLDTFKYSF
jgi:hypothetical protein